MIDTLLLALILGFSTASYITALVNIRAKRYRPNVFSRAVWAVLGVNTFAGVIASESNTASIALGGAIMIGSLAVFCGSLWHGYRQFGRLEALCTVLLGISAFIWIAYDAPLLNVALSLFAHLLGALPTYRQVWKNPRSESRRFWGFFFIASIISVCMGIGSPALKQIVPMYYVVFDGSIFILSLRRKQSHK